MRRDDRVQKLNFSDEFLLDSAERRFQSGDFLGALTMLNKRAGMYAPTADASALYADVYEEMGLWPLAADSWFRFLDTCNEADFGEGYEGLAIAFMNMGNDVQSALYYHRTYTENGTFSEGIREQLAEALEDWKKPNLRIVHSEAGDSDPEALQRGFLLLRTGEVEAAREELSAISPTNKEYPSAAGLAAMCTLMLGEEERAAKECEELLRDYPDNVQALTTYCAVLGATGDKAKAQEVAKRLNKLPVNGVDDLYRVATALCETELDEEAYHRLVELSRELPYDNNVLWFRAVAAYRSNRLEEAIEALERLTTIYPRKAVAEYYLERMREQRDGGESFNMTYFYRMPQDEYRTIADFLLAANAAGEEEAAQLAQLPRLHEFFRIAFDELEGRDEKLQLLAIKVAVKCRADDFLREILLDYEGDDTVKLTALHELVLRNEENSFGTVVYALYKEFFTHEIKVGPRKRVPFMKAFADVYAKYALLSEDNEGKLCAAAEDVYESLCEAEAWEYFEERPALAAAIYREARLKGGERELSEIAALFNAKEFKVKEILDYMM